MDLPKGLKVCYYVVASRFSDVTNKVFTLLSKLLRTFVSRDVIFANQKQTFFHSFSSKQSFFVAFAIILLQFLSCVSLV